MRLKICGITQVQQAIAIVNLGVDTIGFICVKQTPRYIEPDKIKRIIEKLPPEILTVGVFVNEKIETIIEIVNHTGLTSIQLHGEETPVDCQQLRETLPNIEIIKAFRYQNQESLACLENYLPVIDTILLDAYQAGSYGGTGKQLKWEDLSDFRPSRPWLLAGGLKPDNVLQAINTVPCDGLDLSSGVEISPGNKDLDKIQKLCEILNRAC
jgi:phosphoribosylanthranilate isomerase